jgi:hypothetical protein
MRARYALFVVTIWLLLVAGVVNARFRLIADARLFDATPPRPRERLAFSKLWSGRFQAEAERRLEAWWGLRGYAIRTDNTINYRLFGEARPGKPIVVGHDGWLFHVEDTGFISRTDVCTRCDELAARLARAQRAWLAGGRLLSADRDRGEDHDRARSPARALASLRRRAALRSRGDRPVRGGARAGRGGVRRRPPAHARAATHDRSAGVSAAGPALGRLSGLPGVHRRDREGRGRSSV